MNNMKHINNFKSVNNKSRLNKDTTEESKLRASYKERIEKFMNTFSDNPEHWGKATSELPDIHHRMSDTYNEFVNEGEIDGDIYTGYEGRSKTPKEYITKAKRGIRYLSDRLPIYLLKDIIKFYESWF